MDRQIPVSSLIFEQDLIFLSTNPDRVGQGRFISTSVQSYVKNARPLNELLLVGGVFNIFKVDFRSRVVMVRQFRFGTDELTLEFPAGAINLKAGLSELETCYA
jgi:hypothetical protein